MNDELREALKEEFNKMVQWRVRDKLKHELADSHDTATAMAMEEINAMTICEFIEELLS